MDSQNGVQTEIIGFADRAKINLAHAVNDVLRSGGPLKRFNELAYEPVSYTHLTLPTKA